MKFDIRERDIILYGENDQNDIIKFNIYFIFIYIFRNIPFSRVI